MKSLELSTFPQTSSMGMKEGAGFINTHKTEKTFVITGLTGSGKNDLLDNAQIPLLDIVELEGFYKCPYQCTVSNNGKDHTCTAPSDIREWDNPLSYEVDTFSRMFANFCKLPEGSISDIPQVKCFSDNGARVFGRRLNSGKCYFNPQINLNSSHDFAQTVTKGESSIAVLFIPNHAHSLVKQLVNQKLSPVLMTVKNEGFGHGIEMRTALRYNRQGFPDALKNLQTLILAQLYNCQDFTKLSNISIEGLEKITVQNEYNPLKVDQMLQKEITLQNFKSRSSTVQEMTWLQGKRSLGKVLDPQWNSDIWEVIYMGEDSNNQSLNLIDTEGAPVFALIVKGKDLCAVHPLIYNSKEKNVLIPMPWELICDSFRILLTAHLIDPQYRSAKIEEVMNL